MKNHLTIFILFTLILSSCDPALKVKYEIVNKTANPIIVKFQFVHNRSGYTSSQVVSVPGNQSKIVNEDDELGYIDHYNERLDSISLYKLIIQQGNKNTRINFKDKKYWILKKNGEQEGVYQLIFDSTLLNF